MPLLKVLLYQLERLIQIYIPDVYAALQLGDVPCEIFSIQWFLTLFSCDFELPSLAKIWDLFLFLGWKFLFQLSIVILKHVGKKIEGIKLEDLGSYLKSAVENDSRKRVNKI